jgi:hypothetical protein
MIPVKEAVKRAMVFLAELQEANPPEDVTIEEVELSNDGLFWLITISFFPSGSSIAALTGKKPFKQYKIFRVDAESGEVISMKMRDFDYQ